ncbi:MAG: triose-phosphate isomerase [Prevotella sp.]|nr:triose-phosphate isomerase [Prevotella sp.]
MKKLAVNIARVVLAVVFIFSGFVKAVDPLGTQYKIEDYLAALRLDGILPDMATLGISVALAAAEFCLGIFMLFAIRRRLVSRMVLMLMLVMTPLTLWLALTNPISDCGCFGDALVLTNWQTLWKNLVLLLAAIVVAWWPKEMFRFVSEPVQWIVINYTALFILAVSAWSLYYLPQFDFRPYHIGASIREGVMIPADAEQPKFETTYVMLHDGVKTELSEAEYMQVWQDTAHWQCTDVKSVQVSKGYEPPIHDFSMMLLEESGESGDGQNEQTGQDELDGQTEQTAADAAMRDITDEVLSDSGYTFLLVAPYLEKADDSRLDLINELYEYSLDHGYRFYCLTASLRKGRDAWREKTGAEYPFCQTDPITLKTVIRSNPGLVLMKDGRVIRKWSHNDLPDLTADDTAKPLEQLAIGQVPQDSVPGKILKIVLWFVLPLMLLVIADRTWMWTRWIRRKKQRRNTLTINTKENMRKKIVAGNWKMNMNLQDGIALAKELNETLKADRPNCGVVICTPFIHLASIAQFLDQDIIGLGAENCADKEKGAFTGEVSAEMVKSTGAQYVILGHSERREYYKETPEILKEKVLLAQKQGLKVIFCIGESLEEREAGRQNEVVKAELEGSVFNLSEEDFRKIVIAYEPIWAIGTGKTATAEQAQEIHAYIRSIIAQKYGQAVADDTTILYGGSCKASNAPELFAKPDIDGGLIGGASLKAADFKGIIDAFK